MSDRLARFLQWGRYSAEPGTRPWYRPPRFIIAAAFGYEILLVAALLIANAIRT